MDWFLYDIDLCRERIKDILEVAFLKYFIKFKNKKKRKKKNPLWSLKKKKIMFALPLFFTNTLVEAIHSHAFFCEWLLLPIDEQNQT